MLDLAVQVQRNTLIRVLIDGVVADRHAEAGDYVPMDRICVTANFKETQTARMTIGQSATIEIDALPGTHFGGMVDRSSPGSGSPFSLLPFEPGTGNFTKVVQRVPMRIRRLASAAELVRLRPGLSTTVTVQLNGVQP